MAAVYMTSSDEFRRQMEAELIAFYGASIDNIGAGGEGQPGRGKQDYSVYVVWK